MTLKPLLLGLAALPFLVGCEQLGLESMQSMARKQDTEGKAVGGACRQAGRPIEDCYTLNRKMSRAPIYDGWREMDGYMRENKLEATPPKLDPQVQVAAAAPAKSADTGHDKAHSSESRTAWAPEGARSAAAGSHASDSIWSSKTDTDAPKDARDTRVSAAPAASSSAPSDKRLSELEEAARRMGLSTSVVH